MRWEFGKSWVSQIFLAISTIFFQWARGFTVALYKNDIRLEGIDAEIDYLKWNTCWFQSVTLHCSIIWAILFHNVKLFAKYKIIRKPLNNIRECITIVAGLVRQYELKFWPNIVLSWSSLILYCSFVLLMIIRKLIYFINLINAL